MYYVLFIELIILIPFFNISDINYSQCHTRGCDCSHGHRDHAFFPAHCCLQRGPTPAAFSDCHLYELWPTARTHYNSGRYRNSNPLISWTIPYPFKWEWGRGFRQSTAPRVPPYQNWEDSWQLQTTHGNPSYVTRKKIQR